LVCFSQVAGVVRQHSITTLLYLRKNTQPTGLPWS